METSLDNFERDCHLKVFFAGNPLDNNPPPLYIKSTWRPPYESIPVEIQRRLARFYKTVWAAFKQRRGVPNLLPFQAKLIKYLRDHDEWVIANTDKNLGPCAIELEKYIADANVHLNNTEVYEMLDESTAKCEVRRLEFDIQEWISKAKNNHILDDHTYHYLKTKTAQNANDPWSYFYLLYKVHKGKKAGRYPIRLVCSDVASITNPLGKWVDLMLQPMAKSMMAYFKDSFKFKALTDTLTLPTNATLATADAVSMYTNIDTDVALETISNFLRKKEQDFGHYHATTLVAALELEMKNNIIKFGDKYAKQKSGTAMGKPPAPSWANIFQGLHEMEYLPVW